MAEESEIRHGTADGYCNRGCRCGECRNAANLLTQERLTRHRKYLSEGRLDAFPHGAWGYRVGCRCAPCTQKASANKRVYRYGYVPPEPDTCQCCGAASLALVVDHCHKSNEFRGWICSSCNYGIGGLGDDVEGLRMALLYLSGGQ